jgi:hypothetical protein
MSKVYCGVGKIPKNHRKGTMKECAERGQIRLYGLYKVDSRLINPKAKTSSKEKTMNKIQIRGLIVKLAARFGRLKEEMENEKSDKKKKEIRKEMDLTKQKHSHYVLVFKKMKDGDKIEVSDKDDSKKSTKKGTKKGTKKSTKKPTKKGTKK